MKIALAGGLGNQLFQLSAAIYYDSYQNVEIETNLFSPDLTAISSLIGINNLKDISQLRKSLTAEKFANLAIRSSRGVRSKNIYDWFPKLSSLIAKMGLRIFYAPFDYVLSKDVGFSDHPSRMSNESFLIGYFQSSVYAEALKQINVIKLNERDKCNYYQILEKKIRLEKPIVMHIRIGDYVNEPKFGLVTRDYLLEALTKLETISNALWIFSDEIEKAKKLINYKGTKQIHYVDDGGLSTSEVFELMRFGAGYVISNSTFSWWAAFLRFDQNVTVIYPMKWFKDLPTPKNMFPKDWIGVGSQNTPGGHE